MNPQQDADWQIELPNWTSVPDPEFPGRVIWTHRTYDGAIDYALAYGEVTHNAPVVAVLKDPIIGPHDVDGCNVGEFPTWDEALDHTNKLMEEDAR